MTDHGGNPPAGQPSPAPQPGPPSSGWVPPEPYRPGQPATLPPWQAPAPPPWQPPAASQLAWPPPPPEGPAHRSLDGLAAALTVLLAATAAVRLAGIFLTGGTIAASLLFLPQIPVFLVWFYRARRNADGRGQDQRRSPGWAVGAWFVPFVGLVFPFQIMADIWRANLPPGRRAKVAVLPGFWWGCWIAGSGIQGIATPLAGPAPAQARVLAGLADVVVAAAAVLLIVIVQAITRGPAGRQPVTAQPGEIQDRAGGFGQMYPPFPGGGQGARGGAAVAGYTLAAAAVAVVAAVTAATYWLPASTTPVAAPTPTPVAAGTTAAMPAPARLTVDQLRTGDCIQGPPDVNTSRTWPNLVSVVPCSEKHLAEVFYSANYWPGTRAFPGNPVIFRQGLAECRKAFLFYDGLLSSYSKYSFYDSPPVGRQDWNSGDRQLVCIAYYWTSKVPRGKPLFASIKGSSQ